MVEVKGASGPAALPPLPERPKQQGELGNRKVSKHPPLPPTPEKKNVPAKVAALPLPATPSKSATSRPLPPLPAVPLKKAASTGNLPKMKAPPPLPRGVTTPPEDLLRAPSAFPKKVSATEIPTRKSETVGTVAEKLGITPFKKETPVTPQGSIERNWTIPASKGMSKSTFLAASHEVEQALANTNSPALRASLKEFPQNMLEKLLSNFSDEQLLKLHNMLSAEKTEDGLKAAASLIREKVKANVMKELHAALKSGEAQDVRDAFLDAPKNLVGALMDGLSKDEKAKLSKIIMAPKPPAKDFVVTEHANIETARPLIPKDKIATKEELSRQVAVLLQATPALNNLVVPLLKQGKPANREQLIAACNQVTIVQQTELLPQLNALLKNMDVKLAAGKDLIERMILNIQNQTI